MAARIMRLSAHKAEIRKGPYSMASNGGIYVVAYGPIIFGAFAVLRGLFRLVFA